jgi:serine/threonine protein kinase
VAKSRNFDLQPDAFTGQKFGQYDVICQLAAGGMSQIFLAVRQGAAGFQKLVALKRILPEIAEDEEFAARLIEEGNLMGSFSHPNIAQVFDVGRVGDQFFLVLEFVPGVSLSELLRAAKATSERLPVGFTLTVGRAAAEALHHAHAFVDAAGLPRPVIHRDVAPKNIMVTYEGDAKLLDFGVAKSSMHKTSVGRLIGTPPYMSPEQARLQTLDARSDVFSLGVTLHECLTGQRLFAAEGMSEELRAVATRPIPRPSELNPEVPPALDEAVMRALARPREDRFATARDFARALETAAGSQLWGPERVAAVVQSFFADRRELTRQRLQALRSGLPQAPAGPPTVTDPATANTPVFSDDTVVHEGPAPTVPTPTSSRRTRLPLGLVTAALAIAAVAGFVLARASMTEPTVAQSASPVAAPSAAEPAAPEQEPEAAPTKPAPAPERVEAPPPVPVAPVVSHTAARRVLPPAPAKAASANGSLWVKVRPWARVFVDGRLRGETPLDPFAVPAGHHTVLLLNDQLKLRKTYEVDVRPNEEREVKVVLEQ